IPQWGFLGVLSGWNYRLGGLELGCARCVPRLCWVGWGVGWLCLAWLGWACLGLAWLGLAWLGLAWLGSILKSSV
ncbi:hypothetical protein M5Z67_09475, partial [Neisseria meningitidis]|nr:hypothetical protein [Neisseria meningitidis]